MSLTCGCDTDYDYDLDPGEWYWRGDLEIDYKKLSFKRRKPCCSCRELIDIGALALEFPRGKIPKGEIEINIYGEDGCVPIASDYMCEKCGDLYLSLTELGYCINPRDYMPNLVDEHNSYRLRNT